MRGGRHARNIEREGGFTHRRPRGYNNQIGFLQTGKHIIQIFETGRQSAQHAFVLVQFFQSFISFRQSVFQIYKFLIFRTRDNAKNFLFRHIQNIIHMIVAFFKSEFGNDNLPLQSNFAKHIFSARCRHNVLCWCDEGTTFTISARY